MGWCSGTQIFDDVLDAVLPYLEGEQIEQVVEKIAISLWEGDWDCEMDSKYWDILKPIYKRRFGWEDIDFEE